MQQRRRLLELAHRHGARNLRLFGSVVRGQDRPESDVDLLVELEPGRTLIDLAAFRREASALLGQEVDIATIDMLRADARGEVERDSVLLQRARAVATFACAASRFGCGFPAHVKP